MPGQAVGEEPFPNIQLKVPWRSFSRSPSRRVFPPPLPLTAVPALISPQGGSHLPPSPSRPFPPPFQPLRAVPLRAVPACPQPLTAAPAIVSPQGGSCLLSTPSRPFPPSFPLRAVPASFPPPHGRSPQGGSCLLSSSSRSFPLSSPPRAAPAAMFRGHRAWFSQSVSPGPRGLWGEGARPRPSPGEPRGTERAGICGGIGRGTVLSPPRGN